MTNNQKITIGLNIVNTIAKHVWVKTGRDVNKFQVLSKPKCTQLIKEFCLSAVKQVL